MYKKTKHPKLLWLYALLYKTRLTLVALLLLSLSACMGEQKTGVSYEAMNHTTIGLREITINGEGGVGVAYPDGGQTGRTCCVIIPNRWKPGLTVTIGWSDEGKFLRDANGNEVLENGSLVLIPGKRHSKTVEIPEYKKIGVFWIHFFPNEEVKVGVSDYAFEHELHPVPNPTQERFKRWQQQFEDAPATTKEPEKKP